MSFVTWGVWLAHGDVTRAAAARNPNSYRDLIGDLIGDLIRKADTSSDYTYKTSTKFTYLFSILPLMFLHMSLLKPIFPKYTSFRAI